MFDVFVSYTKSDRHHAQRIAEVLKESGLSVWWDHEIPLGKDFHDAIDEQLESAKCIVVLWSEAAVASKWVRSEASVGDERGVLLPVKIQPCRLPVAFRLLQTEQLFDSLEDPESEAWLRIIARIKSLTTPGASPASPSNLEDAPPLAAPIDHAQRKSEPVEGSIRRRASGWLAPSVLIWGGLLYLFLFVNESKSIMAIAIALSIAALVFFKLVEDDINPQMRALVSSWIIPKPGRPKVNIAEALNHMFESVFGRSHWTLKCFARSFIISLFFLVLSLTMIRRMYGASVELTLPIILTIAVVGFFVNGLGNYVLLYKTRLLLRQFRSGWPVTAIAAVDLLLTPIIFVAFLAAGLFSLYAVNVIVGQTASFGGETLLSFWRARLTEVLMQPFYEFFRFEHAELLPLGGRRLLYSCAATALLASIWIWVALLFGTVFKVIGAMRGQSFMLLAFAFDVERAPFSALGYLSSMLIMAVGVAVWGTTEVLASFR